MSYCETVSGLGYKCVDLGHQSASGVMNCSVSFAPLNSLDTIGQWN